MTVNVKDSRSHSYVYLSGYEDENGKNLKTAVNQIKLIAEGNDINNTGDAKADLTALANIIKTNTKDENRKNTLKCLPGALLELKPTDIYDGATAIIAVDCPECTISDLEVIDNSAPSVIDPEPLITDVETKPNSNINGIAEMAALGLHVWRNEMDDMHKRVGELRDSNGEANGMWHASITVRPAMAIWMSRIILLQYK